MTTESITGGFGGLDGGVDSVAKPRSEGGDKSGCDGGGDWFFGGSVSSMSSFAPNFPSVNKS